MEVFPIGFVLIAMFFVARIKNPQTGFIAASAILPLGALAFINLGDFSLLASHCAFAILLFFAISRHFLSSTRHQIPRLELAGFILGLLVCYAVITSQLMPRLFAGDVWVFSMQHGVRGQRVSPHFYSSVTLLKPSSSNISQPVYFLLSALVFLMTLRMARKHGAGFLDKSIYVAAGINGVVGILDLIGADGFLALFKTAEYSIMLDANVGGVPRIVGVLPEASVMGGLSATFFAYLIMRYLDTGKKMALGLAGLNLLWAILALSSTGFAALAFAGLFIVLRSGKVNLSSRIDSRIARRFLTLAMLVVATGIFAALFTNIEDVAWKFADELVFSKGSSLSALERGAWARRGFALGFETYGLGAGLGSTRSNGLFSVLFSNVGIMGVVLYFGFLYSVLRTRRQELNSPNDLAFYNAAAAGMITSTAAQMVSGTTADPGILFMIFASIAVASKPVRYFNITRAKRQGPMHPT